jgi:hypothetical protein
MKKITKKLIALLLILIMAMPSVVIGQTGDEIRVLVDEYLKTKGQL